MPIDNCHYYSITHAATLRRDCLTAGSFTLSSPLLPCALNHSCGSHDVDVDVDVGMLELESQDLLISVLCLAWLSVAVPIFFCKERLHW